MRILLISQYFWPENFQINDVAIGLKDRGYDVTVLTGIPNYPGGKAFQGYTSFAFQTESFNGIPVVRTPHLLRARGRGRDLALNFLSFALSASLSAVCRLGKTFDIIFVYEPSPITVGLPAVLLKKLRKIPFVFWVQDLWPESLTATGAVRSTLIVRAVAEMVKFIYRHCDRILIQSRAFIEPIQKLGVESDRIYYLPNSAETLYSPIPPTSARLPDVGWPAGFRVLFAGNVGAAQDFPTILSAAETLKSYRDIHWIILGDGRMLNWVRQEVDSRGLTRNVHLLGRFPAESMPHFFSLAEVLLVTLKKDPIFSITIPSKIQAYLACGKPIIAALDGEGSRIINEAEAGVTCEAEDPQALVDGVMKMYKMNSKDRQKLGLKGRQYFEQNFEREKLIDRLSGWFDEFRGQVN